MNGRRMTLTVLLVVVVAGLLLAVQVMARSSGDGSEPHLAEAAGPMERTWWSRVPGACRLANATTGARLAIAPSRLMESEPPTDGAKSC